MYVTHFTVRKSKTFKRDPDSYLYVFIGAINVGLIRILNSNHLECFNILLSFGQYSYTLTHEYMHTKFDKVKIYLDYCDYCEFWLVHSIVFNQYVIELFRNS